jgi:predicted O-methyltransferase YrrM
MNKPYNILSKSLNYVRFLLRAKNRHAIHSPFVFDLIESVLKPSYKDRPIEKERKKLLKDHHLFFLKDLGQGKDRETSVASHASKSLKKAPEAKILAKVIKHYDISQVIEFGTSFGITTSYMARSKEDLKLKTVEASADVLNRAQLVWKNLAIDNIESFQISFDQFIDQHRSATFDKTLVFIDGNHQKSPCLRYFDFFITHCSENCILVFDDIHWSGEMEDAWATIVADERVSLTIDLFEMGFVFLQKRLTKEHFDILF